MQLKLVSSRKVSSVNGARAVSPLTSIDLFCGAGGITEGFRQAGYKCLYANDSMQEAIGTFAYNHPKTWVECGLTPVSDPTSQRELGAGKGKMAAGAGGR